MMPAAKVRRSGSGPGSVRDMWNVLLITADDLDVESVARFGGSPSIMPTINALADRSVTFRRAHVAVAVCQPSRSAIMTGRLPHHNGAEGFEPIRRDVPTLTALLRDQGYYNGIIGKVEHLEPFDCFAWDEAWDRDQLGSGRSPRRYGHAAGEFIGNAQNAGRPWFLMANMHDPHRPWHGSSDERDLFDDEQLAEIEPPSRTFEPGESPVPSHLPDLPDVRTEYAQYLSSARRCDDAVRRVLEAVEAAGETDDTIVVFLSDNGAAFPFAKANCYLRSTWTPLLVHWPGVTPAGEVVRDALISAVDIFPTICDAVGIAPPTDLDGASVRHLLESPEDTGETGTRTTRAHVVTSFHETKAGHRFEMRCIQDKRFGYIWNHWSDGRTEYCAENMAGLTWPAMLAAAEHDSGLAQRTTHYRYRVPDELYDLVNDPSSLHNLAGDSDHADTLAGLQMHLAGRLAATGDPLTGAYQEHIRSRIGIQ